MHWIRLLLFGVLFIFFGSCYKEVNLPEQVTFNYNYSLAFNNTRVAFDTKQKLILCPIDPKYLDGWEVNFSGDDVKILKIDKDTLRTGANFFFNNIRSKNYFSAILRFPDGSIDTYSIQFTTLPVFQVFTSYQIPDEPDVAGKIVISYRNDSVKDLISYTGIELRGGSALKRPKKSFKIECWIDEYENAHKDVGFYGLIPDDDWILDGMYLDRARMRNELSLDIWYQIQNDRFSKLPVQSMGSRGGFIELFLNNRLLGLYHLCERVDRKRLGIQVTNKEVEGAIYKAYDWQGPTLYNDIMHLSGGPLWGGWELRYPKQWGRKNWEPLYDFIDFVINSSDEDFKQHIFDYIEMGNVIDYFILLNLTKAVDNWGKNIILARYDKTSPLLFIPWDMDATWGRSWDGKIISATDILSNNLFDRLMELNPADYDQALLARWQLLRYHILTAENIRAQIDVYEALFNTSGAFEREKALWSESDLTLATEVNYMKDWIQRRIEFLDAYFYNLPVQ
jgi:spore coat protein H